MKTGICSVVMAVGVVFGTSARADDSPTVRDVSVEVRQFTVPESVMQDAVRAVGLRTFAVAAAQDPAERSATFDSFPFPNPSPRPHIARAVALREMPLPLSIQAVSAEQVSQLIKAMEGSKQFSQLSAPRLTLREGDTGQIESLQPRPFVTGIVAGDLEADPLDLKPVVHVIDTGSRILVRVQTTPAGERQVDLRLIESDVASVRERSTGMGASLIQIPERTANLLDFSMKLKGDEQLVAWWPKLIVTPEPAPSAVTRASAVLQPRHEMTVGLILRVQNPAARR